MIATALALVLMPILAISHAAQAAPGNGNGGGQGNGGGRPTTSVKPGNGGGHGKPTTTTTTCSYPFNNCPTTTQAGPKPIIVIDLTVAVPGQVVRVTVCGYAPGTEVVITLNGTIVTTIAVGTEPPKTCTSSTPGVFVPAVVGPLGRALNVRAQPGTSGASGTFTVPQDMHPGSYLVCAESQGMETPCTRLNVASSASVLGTTFSNGGAPLVSANNGDSFLAFTGLGLIRLMLLAGVLIAAGLFLVRRDRVRHA